MSRIFVFPLSLNALRLLDFACGVSFSRGRNIFARNTYEDTGAFQFYGHAISNIVAENTMARGTGFLSWGQWRGWLPADTSSNLGGTMNNGAQPNLQNQFFDNSGEQLHLCLLGLIPAVTLSLFLQSLKETHGKTITLLVVAVRRLASMLQFQAAFLIYLFCFR